MLLHVVNAAQTLQIVQVLELQRRVQGTPHAAHLQVIIALPLCKFCLTCATLCTS